MIKILKIFKNSLFKDKPRLLLSSSFINFMRVSKKTDYHPKQLLGSSKVSLHATRCSIKNADFGNEVCDQALKSLKITELGCGCHKGTCTELECMLAVVRNGNECCYYIATGIDAHVTDFQQLKNVPVVYCEGNCILLKKVSEHQEELAAELVDGKRRRNAGMGRDQRNGGNGGRGQ